MVPSEVRRIDRDLDERACRLRQRSVHPQELLVVEVLVGCLQRHQRRLVPLEVAHVPGREVLRSLQRAVGRRRLAQNNLVRARRRRRRLRLCRSKRRNRLRRQHHHRWSWDRRSCRRRRARGRPRRRSDRSHLTVIEVTEEGLKSHVLGRRHLRHCRQCLVPRPHHTQHCCAYCDLPNFETGAHHRDLVEPGGSVCKCLGHALGNVSVDDVCRDVVPGRDRRDRRIELSRCRSCRCSRPALS